MSISVVYARLVTALSAVLFHKHVKKVRKVFLKESRTRGEHFTRIVISMSFSFIGLIASCFGVSCGSVAFSLHFNEVSL